MVVLYFKPEDLIKITEKEGARERTLEALKKFKEADEELERICKELGIDKPELVCKRA